MLSSSLTPAAPATPSTGAITRYPSFRNVSMYLGSLADRSALLAALYRRVQSMLKVHERVGRSDPLQQLLACNGIPRPLQQYRQHLVGLRAQLQLYAMLISSCV